MKLNKSISFALALALPALMLAAQVGTPSITPGSAQAGAATSITITAALLDPSVIASSVNLQQVDGQGRVLKVVGTLSDDGSNGDAVAGDRIFTIRFTSLETQPASLTYRVSAGVLGSVTRIFSIPITYTVTGTVPTGITITQPSNLSFTNTSPIIVSGTANDPGATVQINGVTAARSGTSFQASIPLQEGINPITAVAMNSGGGVSTAGIQVTLDTTPPHVTIDSPVDGSVTTESTVTMSGLVNDIVVGTVNDQEATVTVNGIAAQVANRRYIAQNIPLAIGDNMLQAVARDRTGNSVTVSAKVTRQAATQPFIKLVSGNNQTGAVGQPLSSPLIIQVLNGATPVANIPVIFKVLDSDGFLQGANGKPRLITVNTNAQGNAQASLTLGQRAGAGNNTVQAYAPGFQGIAVFSESATPQAASKIYADTGTSQFGAIGQTLALPFVAVVSDASTNRIRGVSVTFSVKQGGGTFAGKTTIQAVTDGDGRALATLTLGSEPGNDNNMVEANFSGNTGLPATFTASAKTPGNPAQTAISGVVLDNSSNPIPGVTMRLFRPNQGGSNNQPVEVVTPVPTDSKGFFRITSAPVGLFKLMADGATASVTGKVFPTLEYDLVTIAGQDNQVGMPIYLPVLDPTALLCVTATTGGELKPVNIPGFSLKLQPGAATFPGGAKNGCVSVSQVNAEKIPMAPTFGAQPRFIVTIQPIGTIFNPPAAITVPNVDGLPPGAKGELASYDHDLSTFVTIGTATVSADGATLTSDPGVGVLKAGWNDVNNPLPNTTTVSSLHVDITSVTAGPVSQAVSAGDPNVRKEPKP